MTAPSEFRPTWVVTLICGRGGMKNLSDVKYVRASSESRAIQTAKDNCYLPSISQVFARIATPRDLGCTPTPAKLESEQNGQG